MDLLTIENATIVRQATADELYRSMLATEHGGNGGITVPDLDEPVYVLGEEVFLAQVSTGNTWTVVLACETEAEARSVASRLIWSGTIARVVRVRAWDGRVTHTQIAGPRARTMWHQDYTLADNVEVSDGEETYRIAAAWFDVDDAGDWDAIVEEFAKNYDGGVEGLTLTVTYLPTQEERSFDCDEESWK